MFLQDGLEDFQQYAFELKTTAAKNLGPKKIKEYLDIIYGEQGLEMTQMQTASETSVNVHHADFYGVSTGGPQQVHDDCGLFPAQAVTMVHLQVYVITRFHFSSLLSTSCVQGDRYLCSVATGWSQHYLPRLVEDTFNLRS